MFAKIFAQIFDSSISSDYVVRHVFMDLLVLADRDGVVDMTLDAISRRTNVPEEIVAHAIAVLSEEDRKSRSHEELGRRLIPIDSHRDWGWQIVNYEHYRDIKDEEARRAYFRDKKRQQRAKEAGPTLSNSVKDSQHTSNSVKDSQHTSNNVTQAEVEAEANTETKASPRKARDEANGITPAMMARGLAERLGISLGYGPNSFNTAVTEVAEAELKAGRSLEDLCAEMEGAYKFYLQEKAGLRITWGPANFFGQGHWRDSTGWPRKQKSRQERIKEWSAPDDDEGT